MNRRIEVIPNEELEAMQRCAWPGNVRELANLIERAMILSPGPTLDIPIAELEHTGSLVTRRNDTAALPELVRASILGVLEETNWLIAGPQGAAARLGMKRTTLQSLIKRLEIVRPVRSLCGVSSPPVPSAARVHHWPANVGYCVWHGCCGQEASPCYSITDVRETMPDGDDVWTLKLEGNIQGQWVNELRRAWRAVRLAAGGASIRLVLADVQLVDAEGKVLLTEMHRDGCHPRDRHLGRRDP